MNSTRLCLWGSMTCLLLAAPLAPAAAESGLRLSDGAALERSAWPHWQVRFGLAATGSALDRSTRWQLGAGQVFGDYYWSGLRPAGISRTGGFRATSGLLLGPPTHALNQVGALTWPRSAQLGASVTELSTEPWSVVPYVGLGYSAVSLRDGWGFTADLGLAGKAGGLRTRRGSPLGMTQGMDDLLREWRLTPVLSVGASYTF